MNPLAVGAEISGVLGGIAILVGFTIWVWRWRDHTHKSLNTLSAQAAALQTQVTALQEQVAALEECQRDGQEKLVIKFLELRDKVEGISKQVEQLCTEIDERNEVADKQAQLNSYLQVNLNDLDTRLTPVEAQVRELNKGWLRISGGQKKE